MKTIKTSSKSTTYQITSDGSLLKLERIELKGAKKTAKKTDLGYFEAERNAVMEAVYDMYNLGLELA